jgi:hypothetical protein
MHSLLNEFASITNKLLLIAVKEYQAMGRTTLYRWNKHFLKGMGQILLNSTFCVPFRMQSIWIPFYNCACILIFLKHLWKYIGATFGDYWASLQLSVTLSLSSCRAYNSNSRKYRLQNNAVSDGGKSPMSILS